MQWRHFSSFFIVALSRLTLFSPGISHELQDFLISLCFNLFMELTWMGTKGGLIKNNSFVIIKGTPVAARRVRRPFIIRSWKEKAFVMTGKKCSQRPEKTFPPKFSHFQIAFRKISLNFKASHDWFPLIAQLSTRANSAEKKGERWISSKGDETFISNRASLMWNYPSTPPEDAKRIHSDINF